MWAYNMVCAEPVGKLLRSWYKQDLSVPDLRSAQLEPSSTSLGNSKEGQGPCGTFLLH